MRGNIMQQVIRGPFMGRNREIWIQQVTQNGQLFFQASENGMLLRTGMQDFVRRVGAMQVMDAYGNLTLQFEPHLSPDQKMSIMIDFNGRLVDLYGRQRGTIQLICMMKNAYYVMQYDNENIEVYSWSVPGAMFEIFYKDNVQIGQLVKFEKTEKMLDAYCLCLMDGYDYLLDLLILYTLHFDKAHFGHQRQVFYGENVNYHREVSFAGVGKSKYNKDFLKVYFPDIDRMVTESAQSTPKESKWILVLLLSILAVAIVILGIVFASSPNSILLIVELFLAFIFCFMFFGFKAAGML